MTRSFVTGASGFLGSEIVKRLHEKGEEVIAHDILEPEKKYPGVTYIAGDILDTESLLRATSGVDFIYHAAALVPLTKSGSKFYDVNVLGTRNMVSCAKKHGARKLIHISSSAIYGIPSEMPITEKTECHPVEIYGRSKLDAEKEVWTYMKEGGQASCIRPRTIIGGEGRLGIFQVLFEWISENRNVYVIGDGSNLFQFVHLSDLIDSCLKAAASEHYGLYNIGADRFGTLREDLEALIKAVGSSSRVVGLPANLAIPTLKIMDIIRISPLAPWHYLTYHKPFVFDLSKAMRELDWKPRFGNLEALLDSYRWYSANKERLDGEAKASAHKKPLKQGILKVLKWLS